MLITDSRYNSILLHGFLAVYYIPYLVGIYLFFIILSAKCGDNNNAYIVLRNYPLMWDIGTNLTITIMKVKETTTKQKGLERIKFLNSLSILKTNSVIACSEQYINSSATTICELYSRKTKKRIKVVTSALFNNEFFTDNPENYLIGKAYFNNLLIK